MKFFYLSKFNFFQKDSSECELAIHTSETPSLLQFPREYLGKNASVSIISPNSSNLHQYLNLEFTSKANKNDFTKTSEKQIAFKITSMEIKLDFLGISLVNEDDYSNQSNAYEIHSARLRLIIADPNGIVNKRTSKMFRNRNLFISEDISVLTIGKSLSLNYPGVVVITLENAVPYFPHELTFTISDQNKSFEFEDMKMFPADRFYIKCRENIDHKKVIIKCTYFEKIWRYTVPQALSIDERKLKREPINRGLCILINQIKFQDPKLPTRNLGTYEDSERIERVFNKLGYDFKILEDLTTSVLKENLYEIVTKDIKSCHVNIVTFVSSHGDEEGFNTYDGYMGFDDLDDFFLPKNCLHLANISKIFFYSCCLGQKENITDELIPEYSNFFKGFSTVPGYISYRSNDGAPYIQTILDVIEENPLLEVRDIQSETQRRLKYKLISEKGFLVPSESQCLTEPTYL